MTEKPPHSGKLREMSELTVTSSKRLRKKNKKKVLQIQENLLMRKGKDKIKKGEATARILGHVRGEGKDTTSLLSRRKERSMKTWIFGKNQRNSCGRRLEELKRL